MVDLVIAKLQNRRGLLRDLPQPLAPGEIGLCTDTGQMFIGAEPFSGSFISLQSRLRNVDYRGLANAMLDDRIVQVDFGDDPLGTLPTLPDIDDIRDLILADTVASPPDELIVIEDLENERYRAYLGYYYTTITAPPAIPGPDPITLPTFPSFTGEVVRYFGQIVNQTIDGGNQFNAAGLLDLGPNLAPPATDDPYVIADIGAVTEVANKTFLQGISDGLANVLQNLEILTEYGIASAASSIGAPDLLFVPLTNPITTGTDEPTGVFFPISESDVFSIDYSVSGDGGDYVRTGNLLIAATLSPTESTSLSDRYTEVNPSAIDLFFEVEVSGGIVALLTTTVTAGLTIKTNTRRWLSS